MIQMYHVYKSYGGDSQALSDVNLRVEKGEFCFLTGPSGAGKTTLLKIMFGAEEVTAGQIIVGGRNITRIPPPAVPELRRQVGVVFQDFKLIPSMTIFENVAFALRVTGTPRREIRRRVWSALKEVRLQSKMDSYPPRLSGGEQQRVAIARALINDPMLVLADEPTGNLDPDITLDIMKLFLDINVRGTTVVLASHDRALLEQYQKRVLYLENGELRST